MNWLRDKNLFLGFKIALFVLMCWFIGDQLFLKNDFKEQWSFFLQNLSTENFHFFVFAVLLMPVNWLLETLKWRLLIKTTEPFWLLVKSIIAGITLGFITPGRAGEFVGRTLYIAEENAVRIFYLSSIGGIAQSVATLTTGVFFVFIWNGSTVFYGITIGVAATFLFVYFRFDLLNRYIFSNSFLEKHQLIIRENDLPGTTKQLSVLALSFLRFAIYLVQYILLFMFFGVSGNFFELLVHSGVFLVAQTFSPMMPFVDISYRGGTALYVFHSLSSNNVAILCAVMMVWLINLAIPSVVGYLFILNRNMIAIVKKQKNTK